MTKFTKGPWVARGVIPSRIYGMSRPDKEVIVAATGSVNCESAANAHLIAAAPEMYAMLESVKESLGGCYDHYVIEDINNLLKRARGES